MLGNSSSVLMEHNGELLTAGLRRAQWVTANKGTEMEQAFYTVAGTDGSIKKCLDLPRSDWDILLYFFV